MAGDWIKMRCNLAEDPAVIAMAARLKLDEDTVVGKLHRFWSWVDQQTTDGHGAGVTRAWLDRYVRCDGFAAAMESQRWVEFGDDGLTIPNFQRHNGQTAKGRGLAADRQEKRREKVSRGCHAPAVTRALPEKRREEKSNTTPKAPASGGGGGGDAAPVVGELVACGVRPDVSADLAATVPGLSRSFVRLAFRQAERDADSNPPGLLAHWLRHKTTPPPDLSPKRIVELVNAGDVVAVRGHRVRPGCAGYNAQGLHVFSDPSRCECVALVAPAEITVDVLDVSEVSDVPPSSPTQKPKNGARYAAA